MIHFLRGIDSFVILFIISVCVRLSAFVQAISSKEKKQIDHKSRVIVYRQTKRKFYAASLINMIIKKR